MPKSRVIPEMAPFLLFLVFLPTGSALQTGLVSRLAGHPAPAPAPAGEASSDETVEGAETHETHAHHSIFRLHMSTLDSYEFWEVLIMMLFATTLVDRGIWLANYWVSESKTMQRFLSKVFAELMLFGCVAISLFIYTNLCGHMTEETHLLFEFADILCSFGACGMILIAVILFSACQHANMRWARLELGLHEDAELSANYKRLKKSFCARQGLKQSFPFNSYLDEVLAESCIRIISLEWYTWLLFATLPFLGFLLRTYHASPMTDGEFMNELRAVNWLVCFTHLGLLAFVHITREQLFHTLANAETPRGTSASKGDSRLSAKAIENFEWGFQIVTLVNAFLLAMFFMSGVYNALFYNPFTAFFWTAIEGVPLLLNTLMLFPLIMIRFSMVRGYYAAEADVIGYVLEADAKLAEDMAFLKKSYENLGRPKIEALDEGEDIGQLAFKEILQSMNLYLTEDRRTRLFNAMDEDCGGTISADEIVKALGPANDLD